jgi:D-aminopeptidase
MSLYYIGFVKTATKNFIMKITVLVFCLCTLIQLTYSQKPRARDIGIPFEGNTGKNNAITI